MVLSKVRGCRQIVGSLFCLLTNYRRLNIQAIERDIEMLIAKERAEGLTDQERAILVNLLKGKEEQKKQLVNPS